MAKKQLNFARPAVNQTMHKKMKSIAKRDNGQNITDFYDTILKLGISEYERVKKFTFDV